MSTFFYFLQFHGKCLFYFIYDERYLPIKESKLEEKEQRVSGGDTVFCDQCNLHYCRTCCNTLRKPVERHRGVTCAANQLGDNKDVGFHRLYILDELCNLRCPRCRAVIANYFCR